MTPVRMFAQIALPVTLLVAGLTLSPSTSHAAGLSVLLPTTDGIFERGGSDDPNECTIDDRCATDQGTKIDIAGSGRGGHDDPNECTIDDRCATDSVPRTLDRA